MMKKEASTRIVKFMAPESLVQSPEISYIHVCIVDLEAFKLNVYKSSESIGPCFGDGGFGTELYGLCLKIHEF